MNELRSRLARNGKRPALQVIASLALFLVPFFLPPLFAQEPKPDSPIHVSVEPISENSGSHGYVEYGIIVTNRSPEQAHHVQLKVPGSDASGRGDYLRAVSRSVQVGPASAVRVPLPIPALPSLADTNLGVKVDGRTLMDRNAVGDMDFPRLIALPNVFNRRRYPYSYCQPQPHNLYVLLSRSVDNNVPEAAEKDLPAPEEDSRHGAPSTEVRPGVVKGMTAGVPFDGQLQFVRTETPVSAWSTSWLAYSRFDGIAVSSDDMRIMPAGARTALLQYVECGGSLLVVGPWNVPENWKRRQQQKAGLACCLTGFGRVFVNPEPDCQKWTEDQWDLVRASWMRTASPFQKMHNVVEANNLFPVVEDISIPIRGLSVLMLLFALVIGPVNLLLLSRWKRRIWMLWTTPAISLATCLAVFGYMLIAEGWEGHLRTESLTILDETTHRASTIGWTAFYAPVAPNDGLHFSYDTELSPQIEEETYWRRRNSGGTARTLDWTHEQHLASGWLSARIPAHFMVRKSETRRERVAVSREPDGALTAVNGLGTEIRELWYADAQGRIYRAGPIEAGAQAALTPTEKTLEDAVPLERVHVQFQPDWTRNVEAVKANPASYLFPHSYVAVLEAAPFIEEGLRNVKTRRCAAVVLGIMKEASDEN